MNSYSGPSATLDSTAAAGVRIVIWCWACNHRVEPDPAVMAQRYGADTAVRDWHKRLICSRCGGREIDFVLTGAGEGGRRFRPSRHKREDAAWRLPPSARCGTGAKVFNLNGSRFHANYWEPCEV